MPQTQDLFLSEDGAVETVAGAFTLSHVPAPAETLKVVHPDYAPAVVAPVRGTSWGRSRRDRTAHTVSRISRQVGTLWGTTPVFFLGCPHWPRSSWVRVKVACWTWTCRSRPTRWGFFLFMRPTNSGEHPPVLAFGSRGRRARSSPFRRPMWVHALSLPRAGIRCARKLRTAQERSRMSRSNRTVERSPKCSAWACAWNQGETGRAAPDEPRAASHATLYRPLTPGEVYGAVVAGGMGSITNVAERTGD